MVVISPTQDIVEASSFVNRKPGRMKIFTAFDHLEYERIHSFPVDLLFPMPCFALAMRKLPKVLSWRRSTLTN